MEIPFSRFPSPKVSLSSMISWKNMELRVWQSIVISCIWVDKDSFYTPSLDIGKACLRMTIQNLLMLLKLKSHCFSQCDMIALGKLQCNFITHISTGVLFGSRHNVLNARARNIIIHYCVLQGRSRCILKYLGKKLESPENKWERLFFHNGN